MREYLLKARRPFLTLYFIPTIPIGGEEYFILCAGCRSHWDPAILQIDAQTHQQLQEERFGQDAFRATVLVALADGELDELSIETLIRISGRLLPDPVSREELGFLCSSAVQNGVQPLNYVLSVSGPWATEQRQFALQAMFVAATSGGELTESQLALLSSLRDALELTDAEYQQAVEAAIDWDISSAAD